MQARYYSPGVGRFLSEDPYGGAPQDPLSLHRYLYCANGPASDVDPAGRSKAACLRWCKVRYYMMRVGEALNPFEPGFADAFLKWYTADCEKRWTPPTDWAQFCNNNTDPCWWGTGQECCDKLYDYCKSLDYYGSMVCRTAQAYCYIGVY